MKSSVADLTITFQSTPPVKAATLKHCILNVNVIISIHAAREGGDGVRQAPA